MAEPNTPQKPAPDAAAESPTTAQPIDFDDDQDNNEPRSAAGLPPRSSSRNVHFDEEEAPPSKPPRPTSPQQQAEATLVEAFPSIDANVIKAVLVASGGNVEPAFNALLGMSDPSFKAEQETPPAQPPRPQAQTTQMQRDEMYARQLAAHYNSQGGRPSGERALPPPPPRGEDDKDYNFFDDELPAIRENMRQGFLNTQTKVNKWISDFRKRMDGDDEDEIGPGPAQPQRQNFGPSQAEQLQGIKRMAAQQQQQRGQGRRSTDQDRYDADPQVLGDDFAELELRDEENDDAPPQKPPRPAANPNLFKPTPVAPQSGPVDEVDALYRTPTPSKGNGQSSPPSAANTKKKWQPLTSVAPAPEGDDNDPFSVGDSDDEAKTKDINEEATERLKKAASESETKPEGAGEGTKTLEAHERSGSLGVRDKAAEEILKSPKDE